MRKSIKAVLLSALVFPGIGHFALKRYQRGLIFFIPALLSLSLIVYYILSMSFAIADQIAQNQVPLNAEAISQLMVTQHNESDLFISNAATWLFTVSWIIGMVDAFRLGRQADIAQQAEEK